MERCEMGRKETEEAIADCRAGRVTWFGSVAELLADLNADDTPDIQQGSTNVYADLGYSGADEMQAKATLVTKIGQAIKALQLSNDQAATALGLTPAELNELLAGRFRAHSVDDLESLTALLDEAGR
ncbi:XRE family transcriptional regulator [Methyloparacoccus murrellii]